MMTPDQKQQLEDIIAECDAQAEKAAQEMLFQKRQMQKLRQRAFILRSILPAT